MSGHRNRVRALPTISRTVLSVGLVVASMSVIGPPAAAECTLRSPAWPSFREIAPSAQRIVVGTVAETESQGVGQPFTLVVEDVLQGSAPARMHIEDIRSGLPSRATGDCAGELIAQFGDRIAIAFDGRAEGTQRRVTTAAWIEGQPAVPTMLGAETLTIEEVRAAAGQPAPDPAWASGDAEAATACAALLKEGIPEVEVRSGQPSIVAAYRLTGEQWADYTRMMDANEEDISEELEALRSVETFDVCAIDGDMLIPDAAGEPLPAVRVAVGIGPDGPRVRPLLRSTYVARERTDEVPIRFDLLR